MAGGSSKERHNRAWKPPDQLLPASDNGIYRMTFGKHTGLTVKEVIDLDGLEYFKVLVASQDNVLTVYADLRDALAEEGYLDALLSQRSELQRERAERTRMTAEDARNPAAQKKHFNHPENKKLRLKQQVQASAFLRGSAKADALDKIEEEGLRKVAKRKRSTKRRYISRAKELLGHCGVCGAIGHKRPTCPYKDLQGEGVPLKTLMTIAWEQNKSVAALISRLKYTPIQGRSQVYEQRATQRARGPSKTSFLELCRAKPSGLADLITADFLRPLEGVPCPRKKCIKTVQDRPQPKVLSKRCFNDAFGPDINLKTVWHKCLDCKIPQSIAIYNPLFAGFIGKGGLGVTYATLGFWNAVEGVSQTTTVL